MPRYFLSLVLLSFVALLAFSSICWGGINSPAQTSGNSTLEGRERLVWKPLRRSSQFSDIPHLTPARCEEVEPPQAIATPDPLWIRSDRSRKVKVSFIIGTDGRVHSPLILESAGPRGDRSVLQTVRNWRYRPGTCNGVPTETEGKIEFSVR
jgi:TonB family protein